ncbi:methyltransferase [Chitinophaga nivalis]|uniref:Methyltransferase n=1 Tax=Chitinophaga nivalis TaxID=2991709 RepID=A0ABT3II61_9BACT|nr:methyltransferase [Chitinophaga nivalis]MCW3466682.1 methyltransferase [Chitinophaga nivalis]MCW3483627.1 methyltransferase [Chitinophaga nivalis]
MKQPTVETSAISASDAAVMFNLSISHWYSCCVYVAAKLGIADELKTGGKTVAELAAITDSDPDALHRILRVLFSINIFKEADDGTIELTSLARTLQEDAPDSMKGWILTAIGHRLPLWSQLLHSVKTGQTAFKEVYGAPVWEYYTHNKQDGENFIRAMANLTRPVIEKIVTVYDFSPYQTIVDVGGGNGTLLINILGAFPESSGVVFDEPYVAKITSGKIEASAVKDRCTATGGSFFETVPAGADLYILKNILHDWNDKDVARILQVCARAMRPDSRLLVLETIIPAGNEVHYAKLNDVNMLLAQGGRERTGREYEVLAAQAGLQLVNIVDIGLEECSIIEIIKKE